MVALLYTVFTWLVRFLIARMILRIAGFLTIYVIEASLVDYAFGFIESQLGQFSAIQILQLTGIGEAVQIIAGAFSLRLLIKGTILGPGAGILGGGA